MLPSLNFPQLDFVKASSGFHAVTWERVILGHMLDDLRFGVEGLALPGGGKVTDQTFADDTALYLCCRNPNLVKCGGEAQHLEKWGFGVLRDSRMFRARQQGAEHLVLGCSWCHWKGLET